MENNKIVLITGANKGLGFEAARILARQGCTVLLGARNPELGQAAVARLQSEALTAHFVHIDLDNRPSITAAAREVESQWGRVDILINNAAIADRGDGLPSKVDVDGAERMMRTNFIGTLAVTQAFLPLVRKSAAGRIVNVSSELGSLTLHSDPTWKYAAVKLLGYCATKSALNMLTVQLAAELRDTNIKVNSANPGYTATDLNNNQGPKSVQEGVKEIVRLALLPNDGPTGGYFETEGPIPW